MPPFKTGFFKRKIQKEKKTVFINFKDAKEDKDLIRELRTDGDDTDSEHEFDAQQSDEEQEGVLFNNEEDSLLGDKDNAVDIRDEESSDLTDSEADGSNNDEDTEENETESLLDSEEESGLGQTHSGSSDESDSPTQDIKEKQKAQDNKPVKKKLEDKNIKIKSKEKSEIPDENNAVEKLQNQIDNSHITIQKDEYESGDTSDEEERRNTVGEVPMRWYDEYPHLGYDLDARRIIKPPQRDQIDQFLKQCEDPDFWRTVRDPSTGQDVVLSKEDLQLIARIKESRVPNPKHEEFEPWIEWFTREVMVTPLRAFPDAKRSFLPSKSEQQKISKIVHALKMGWLKTRKQLAEERRAKREKQFYNLWGTTNEEEERLRGIHKHIPAPRRPMPTHAESYNPPPEYLLDKLELKEWNKLAETPWKRKYTFLPTKHASLREVPAYDRFIRERFLRCLDLYLAPRAIKMRLTINPEDLIPKLPSPRDLQPFPTTEVLLFKGHTNLARSADFDPTGQYVVSGSEDGTIKVWETSTGRCLRTIDLGTSISRVAWTPSQGLSLIAAAAGSKLLLLNPGADIGAHRVAEDTDKLLEEPPPSHDVVVDERTRIAAQWEKVAPEQWVRGVRVSVTHFKPVTHISWHARGDYIVATMPDGASRAVIVHQLSRRRSQLPFNKAKGLVQCAVFHPTRPFLFVATQRVVRIYDLVKQELVKKLLTGAQWISTIAVHPAGDNLLVASYDRKCMWFDLDLSSKPYQTLRLHGGAVRAIAFHRRYPLFATAGDDHNIIVSHGMVYNDLLQNPLLVPLKQLRGHERNDELCVLDLRFHPTQPWLLSAGADSTLRLFT